MQWNFDAWLMALGRMTLMVAVSAVIVTALLSLLRVRSTALRRAAWMIVLLQGWLAAQIPIVIKRPAPPADEPVVAADSHPTPATMPALPAFGATPHGTEPDTAGVPPLAETTASARATSPPIVPASPQPAGRGIPWTALLLMVWAAGAVLTIVVGVFRYLLFLRRLRSTEAPTNLWQDEFQQTRAALGIKKLVQLRISADAGPCLIRRRSGTGVVVPRDLWMDLTPRQRMAILRHELAHYQRGDLWKSLAVRLLSTPQWFNPAAWWAVRRFDECAEWACDEIAAGDADGATEFSKLLLVLGTRTHAPAPFLPAVRRGQVSTRIRRLLVEQRRELRAAGVLVPLVGAGLAAVSLLRIDVVAQTPAAAPGTAAAQHVAGTQRRMPWHPDELVAVLGSERGTLWSQADHLVVTPDGRRVIANGGQNSLFILDAETLSVIGTFGERRSRLMSVALSRDGTRLLTGYLDGTMAVWNMSGADPELEQSVNVTPPALEGQDVWYNYAHALSADRVAITAGFKVVTLWELIDGRLNQVLTLDPGDDAFGVTLSPDGQRMVTKNTIRISGAIPPERLVEVDGNMYTRHDCRLRLWGLETGVARELNRMTTADMDNITFSADGKRLFGTSQSSLPPIVTRCIRVEEDTLVEEANLPLDLSSRQRPAFSADKPLMAIGVSGTADLAIVDTSQPDWHTIATLDGSVGFRSGVAFGPRADSLFVATTSCLLERWDRSENGEYTRFTPQSVQSSLVRDLSFSLSGESLTVACGETIREWDLSRLNSPEPDVHATNLTPFGSSKLGRWTQGSSVLFHISHPMPFNGIGLWNESRREVSETFQINFGDNYRNDAWCFAVHPDGKALATGHWDHAIRFWSLAGEAPRMIAELSEAHGGHVCDIAFSPDGTMLASGGWENAVKLWDISTDPPSEGGELGRHEEIVRSVAFSPDSRWLASGDEAGVIRLWDLKSADLSGATIVHPDDVAHPKSMNDGRTVNTLEFSADNSRLLSADGAGRVIVWSVPSGEIIKEWQFPGWVWVARWSPDESLIATGNQNGTVYLLAAPE